jgi:HlyD family secretion protein
MKKINNKKITIVAAAMIVMVVVATAGILFYLKQSGSSGKSKFPYALVKVEQGDFSRQISLTGTVKAAQDVNLSFARSGKVAKVNVKAGDSVQAGEIIAELDKADIYADYLSAAASRQSAQANLDSQKLKKQNMINGATTEDVAVSQTQVANAEKALIDAQTTSNNTKAQADASMDKLYAQIDTSLADAYNKSYDAVYNQTDSMFQDSSVGNPRLVFYTALDSQDKSTAESSRLVALGAIKQMDIDRKGLAADYSNYVDVFKKMDTDLGAISSYLNDLSDALSNTSPSSNYTSTEISAGKSVVSTAITAINSSTASLDSLKQSVDLQEKVNQNNLSSAQASVDQAQNALNLTKDQLTLKKSGSTSEELGMQDQAIKQAEASLNAAAASVAKVKTELDDAAITAPIDGTITSVNLDQGEAVSANAPVIGLESVGKFQVETYLPELNVGEVATGQSAKITFDAYGTDRVFDAKVVSVDPAAQSVNGILAYRTLLQFVNEDKDIKTGLTANIKILTADDHDVLSAPDSSIIKSADKSFVIMSNGERKEVTIGKSDGLGKVEILYGLSAGDNIADFGSSLSR